MSAREDWPRALFGGSLQGENLAKQLNIDESGRAENEPVVVVAGVLVDVDKEFASTEQRVAQAVENAVPEHLRDGFVFHAKDVFGKIKRHEGWDIWDCNRIIDEWIQIRHDLDLPIVISWRRKNPGEKPGRYSSNDLQHAITFANCVQGADDFLKKYWPDEAATVIAEDCPEMRGDLRKAVNIVRAGKWREKMAEQGFRDEVRHIKGGVLFALKDDTPALQIADAYAYAFMRYATGKKGGDRLWHKILGQPDFHIQRDVSAHKGGGQLCVWHGRAEASGRGR